VPSARAADPQGYGVTITSTGERAIDASLNASSELLSLRDSAPVSPLGLVARAQSDIDRLKTVLESFGYYQGGVAITIDGMTLADPGLGDALNALAQGTDAQVTISCQLGPLYHLRRITIDGELPDSVRPALGLTAGAPAVAADVLAGAARLLTALEEQGFALAKVDAPIAYEDPGNRVLDLIFHVETGPKVQVGEIQIEGLEHLNRQFVLARLVLQSGEPYRASQIERARQDLLGMGVFSSVSVQLGTSADAQGRVPVTFQVRERPQHRFSINAAYSTDLGGSSGLTWENRDLFGNAEQLIFAASVINVGGDAATAIGYDTSLKLIKPEFGHRDQSLQLAVGAIQQSLKAYDQTMASAGATLSRKISSIWTTSIGLAAAQEHIVQQGTSRDYTLLSVPLGILYNSTGLASPLDDPRHGLRASLRVVPTQSIGDPSATFIITQAAVAAYLDLHALDLTDPGRSVLAARAMAGIAQGASEFGLPPDQRFYAGGSDTIRGYRYQSVGPLFADGSPIGGTAIDTGSVEFRQRIGSNAGATVFVDGGQVSAIVNPLTGSFRIGVGAGIRYYTPIGPIRLDFAVPTNRRPTDDAFEVYIGLGQAF
jgi:translocation and assembly module TamA